ncbi:hypothetical protein IU500_07050 [Nocardia terpenica]|uniref:hypothetical protein n=1 Tax=Nocardia terpenica TaxID=455432 RepID=UPI00189519DD|nr:hypothetical protein [Nocardia terpenica]MBF6060534.1 hypothetical protein [Nocardia terpenica]MBF6103794.1 hypothetical protein [Nocardia terpenica]MBF6111832.1 hypothetical protein [Nocardia terpenica]MBF6118015.1 hypothetical protein [Nocardia terpenica]MBF6155259.1 hypothetical protein [Nocardia terpenica]
MKKPRKKLAVDAPKILGTLTDGQRASVIMIVTGLLERADLGATISHGDDGSVLIHIPARNS